MVPQLAASITGFDAETKDTARTAYIIAASLVTINMKTFKLTEISAVELDPECPTAIQLFTSSEGTLKWWNDTDEVSKYKPSLTAKKTMWGGSTPHKAGVEMLSRFLHQVDKQNTVLTARGPDFDMVAMENTVRAYNLPWTMRFSRFDSDRTHERISLALGLPNPTVEEMEKWGIRGEWHTAAYDASVEAYNAARTYWCAAICSLDGPEGLAKAVAGFLDGTFTTEPYIDRVTFNV